MGHDDGVDDVIGMLLARDARDGVVQRDDTEQHLFRVSCTAFALALDNCQENRNDFTTAVNNFRMLISEMHQRMRHGETPPDNIFDGMGRQSDHNEELDSPVPEGPDLHDILLVLEAHTRFVSSISDVLMIR